MKTSSRMIVLKFIPGATILDERQGGADTSVDDFEQGYQLFYHGLNACAGDTDVDSYAFIVQVVE